MLKLPAWFSHRHKFCTWRDTTSIVSCVKFCSDHYIRSLTRSGEISVAVSKWSVKWIPFQRMGSPQTLYYQSNGIKANPKSFPLASDQRRKFVSAQWGFSLTSWTEAWDTSVATESTTPRSNRGYTAKNKHTALRVRLVVALICVWTSGMDGTSGATVLWYLTQQISLHSECGEITESRKWLAWI